MKRSVASRYTKIRKLDKTLFGGENVGSLDISVDNALFVKIQEAMQYLRHVKPDQVFGEFTKVLGD